jgi:tripartite-type tricarboxylate transporter receptor subunit TctC
MSHLVALRFMAEQGIDAVMVPYRSVGLLLQDMMESRVDLGLPAYAPQLKSLRPLAVTSEARTPAVPEVPTAGETGVSNMVAST